MSSLYGEKYHQSRKFKNKNESAQEAHEAIRPTSAKAATIREQEWQKLYELIWKRTMASQMADAELEKTTVNIEISTNKEELTASGEVLKFDGFLKVYREDKDEDEQEESSEGMLPPMTTGTAIAAVRAQGNRAVQPSSAAIYRSVAGKEIRGARHRSTVHLRTDDLYDPEKRVRRKAGQGRHAEGVSEYWS